jgi:hypothetical protein
VEDDREPVGGQCAPRCRHEVVRTVWRADEEGPGRPDAASRRERARADPGAEALSVEDDLRHALPGGERLEQEPV